MKQIEVNSEGWVSLLAEIADNHADGSLIPHDWLRGRFGLEKLNVSDFENTDDFVRGIQMQQFSYMTLVDTLRWQLLEEEKMYIRNIRGDGYAVVPACDQTKYGYDEMFKNIKSAIKDADLIMSNVRAVSVDQQAADNDLRAKYSILKQMLSSIRK